MKYRMYTIGKNFTFDAAHKLEGLPSTHPCSKLHGHTYTVKVAIRANRLNDVGMVVDYRDLSACVRAELSHFDHVYLNEIVDFNPTAENLAQHFATIFGGCVQGGQIPLHPAAEWSLTVTVQETPGTWSEFTVYQADFLTELSEG